MLRLFFSKPGMSDHSTTRRKKAQGDKASKQKDSKPCPSSESLSGTLSLRLREAGILVLIVLAGFLSLALSSYSPEDPGWYHIGFDQDVHNAAGLIGVWLASSLFSLFGVFAWLIPLVLVIKTGLVIHYRYQTREWRAGLFALRIFGLLVALCSGAALAELYLPLMEPLPSGSGGVSGRLVLEAFVPAFNRLGSSLILLAVFITGLTLYTDISWFRVIDVTGQLTWWFMSFIYRSVRYLVTSMVSSVRQAVVRGYNSLGDRIEVWRDRRALAQAEKEASEPPRLPVALPRVEPVLAEEPVTLVSPAPVVVVPGNQKRKLQEPLLEELPEGDFPTVGLLDEVANSNDGISQDDLNAVSRLLELKLKDFGVDADVVAAHPGPVITRYEIQPAPGVKASKITNLAKDLARSLAVVSVRVVEVIPGKSVMGIEIPNDNREIVYFGELISSNAFDTAKSPLSLSLGHNISGQPVIVDLARMPHLLVAGTTGSGKSVGVNAMILSMLFKAGPDEVRMIMIDPKMLELSIYDGIPHLLSPVVTDMKEAANALRWCVAEMERRYKLMAALGVRNIGGYNQKVKDARQQGEPLYDPFFEPLSLGGEAPPELDTLPFIVVVVDEFADMMMIVGKKVEELIARIAQKARAAGIHLILATQRPSVDVITGLIKANVPTRISFQVSSKIDSRTIIDQGGAEQLLGHGDMLYLPPGTSVPIRVHGAFVSDNEVHRVVADWKKRGEPDYIDEVLSGVEAVSEGSAFSGGLDDDSEQDSLYDEAVAFVTESRRVSISSVQRKFKIGYNRSANIIEAMEQAGVISPAGVNGSREVIAPPPVKN